MPVFNPQKTVTPAEIRCGETASITLSFDAQAAFAENPADIILIMDRSGSMASPRIQQAQAAAKEMISIVVGASGGTGAIASGSSMGIVSFATTATADLPLSQDEAALDAAINSLTAGGSTNHSAAFEEAEKLLPPKTPDKRQIVVMFTDGITTVGPDSDTITQRMKDAGVEIYCILLGTDMAQVNVWASAPTADHVADAANGSSLTRIFKQTAAQIVLAGGLDIKLRETVHPDFKIISAGIPTAGTATVTGLQTLSWDLDSAGLLKDPETYSLTLEVLHTGSTGGTLEINQALTYSDKAGTELNFPKPTILVDCNSTVVFPEPCPTPLSFAVESCRDAINVALGETNLSSLGRIIQVDATVKSVCPGRQVAVAVILTEVDDQGVEHHRGIKTLTLPPITGTECQDVTLRCLRFVVPETLKPDGDTGSLCSGRNFRARVMANYVDTDFVCCDGTAPII